MTITNMNPLRLIAATSLAIYTLLSLQSQVFAVPATPTTGEQIAQAQPQSRLRIAVLDFDYASIDADFSAYDLFNGVGPAQGVSSLLTNKLVQDGTYSVIERSRVEEILREQNFGQSGRVDASTAAEIGRILGVDVVIIGSITQFNLNAEESGLNILGFGQRTVTYEAEVQLTARLVNTTTAEIVIAAEGIGTAEERDESFSIGGIGGVANVSSKQNQLLKQAAETAVSQLTEQLTATTSRITPLAQPTQSRVNAVVADVINNQIILNQGTQAGLSPGMVLAVERIDREVTDPTTGEVIRTMTSPVGQIELTDVDARSAVGRVLSGTGFQIGDRVTGVK